jgi:DNA polymerase zeta
LFSPSRADVNGQMPPRHIALLMEPDSNYFHDPVIVVDFQSLYPSVIIAYNLCYSTCLGQVPMAGKEDMASVLRQRMGCTHIDVAVDLLASLGPDNIFISPNNVMFAKQAVRAGVLPTMLREILETRKMTKERMRHAGDDALLRQMLDFSQLALKMIANVTYGYTSASFTGRMPCIDIADAIVSFGERTLRNALTWVEAQWPSVARVVYGDTDSLFIQCKGCSKERAFEMGKIISERITQMNPAPVKLNFEKVRVSLGCLHHRLFNPTATGLSAVRVDGKEALCGLEVGVREPVRRRV